MSKGLDGGGHGVGVSRTTKTSTHSFWKSVEKAPRGEVLVGGRYASGKEIFRISEVLVDPISPPVDFRPAEDKVMS